ncbi:hypothetical protein NUSPORA_00057 [Nucleospora cyclopteri]
MQEYYLEELEKVLKDLSEIPTTINNKQILMDQNEEREMLINQLQNKNVELYKILQNAQTQVKKLEKDNLTLSMAEKKLRNENLDLKGAVRVYCRIKPSENMNRIAYNDREIEFDNKKFVVDRVFSQNAHNQEVFDEMELFVENVLDGYKICIFAYGQTGSGKTYTMQGKNDGLIFKSLEKLQKITIGQNVSYNLQYVEIYNECIIDLFTGKPLYIQHDKEGVKIKDASAIETKNINQVIEGMKNASAKRKVGETQCNVQSSRSHAIFILKVTAQTEKEVREGVLCLIDLAGSERLSQSKAENERLRETQNINKSLSALGNVFTSIRRKEKHVPFRDSKLTHIMQEYLTGNSRTAMIVNLNPDSINESVCSLRFATKVSECLLGKAERNAHCIN